MKFFLLGAVYWIIVAAVLASVVQFWPDLARSQTFFYMAIAGALLGVFAVMFVAGFRKTRRENPPPTREEIMRARRE